jgi:hypothetical protein
LSDDNRVPFPGLTTPPNWASYVITALGRVYRNDGRLLAVDEHLNVRLNKGRFTRSVPAAVAKAFGHPPPRYQAAWRPWVDPDGPIDPLTGRTRCSVADIKYVPHSELVAFGRTGTKPKTSFPLL